MPIFPPGVVVGPAPADRPDLGPCWLWAGSLDKGGYGPHRAVYKRLVGAVPKGLHLDHLCRTRNCVRPEHLEPVTPRENTRRSMAPAGVNARKTHCDHGHALDEVNTYVRKDNGNRVCRTCRDERVRLWRERHAVGG